MLERLHLVGRIMFIIQMISFIFTLKYVKFLCDLGTVIVLCDSTLFKNTYFILEVRYIFYL